jgi:DNA-binding transcriptional ArsR family regulator
MARARANEAEPETGRVAVLRALLADGAGDGLRACDVAARSGVNETSVRVYLMRLYGEGLIARDGARTRRLWFATSATRAELLRLGLNPSTRRGKRGTEAGGTVRERSRGRVGAAARGALLGGP